MSGNVSEWVQDCYNTTYNGAPTDGSALDAPSCTYGRVARGGHLGIATASENQLTVSYRASWIYTSQTDSVGFRCAR